MPDFKPGDWKCRCGSHNFASRRSCRDCGRGKPETADSRRRPGDWDCPNCHGVVFASKDRCRCGGTKVGAATTERKPGDWDCVCGESNFGTRIVCRGCAQARPDQELVNNAPTEDSTNCVICMEARANMAPSGCGHLAMCEPCSKQVNNTCPMCRRVFSQLELVKIFPS